MPAPDAVAPRKGMPSPRLDEAAFKARFRAQFQDQAFGAVEQELEKIAEAAWDAYAHSRKSPRTQKAGSEFSDPSYDLAVDWLNTHRQIETARQQHDDRHAPIRILLINGSPRSEHTCPGEMSKTYRLAEIARDTLTAAGTTVDVLDLSRLTSEYGRHIHPCKACFSTAAALCHWPCSCYPNYSLGQTQDWMNDIYPMWVAAHGVMIITPVHWYFSSSPLKLMMDRLVCADGGNPDPTSTHGKNAGEAKKLELDGWDYPRHLRGRVFSVVVHGDAEGAENARRSLFDWLCSMELLPAAAAAQLDRYIGYWKPYATSHDDLDEDRSIQREVEQAARILADVARARRSDRPDDLRLDLKAPREK